MIEPRWFMQAVAAIKAGVFVPYAAAKNVPPAPDADRVDAADLAPYEVAEGIAHIVIAGQMQKGESSFGGTSTVNLRRQVRHAVGNQAVKAILLHIDSPGGTAAGTASLADDVKAADAVKPVYTHFEDTGASAAYFVGSQARRVTADRGSEIGSIGTVAYVVDTSGEFKEMGWKAHVISTGKFKGSLADGVEISKDDLGYLQDRVDAAGELFVQSVASGRRMKVADVQALADGRVHDAAKAQELGLIDEVLTVDDAVGRIKKDLKATERAKRKTEDSMRRTRALSQQELDIRSA